MPERLFALLLLFAACTNHSQTSFDPSKPLPAVTGVYDVSIETTSDTCTPRLPTGPQPAQLLTITATGVTIEVPVSETQLASIPLTTAAGYLDTLTESGPCDAQNQLIIQLYNATEDVLDANYQSTWTDVTECATGVTASCASQVAVHFNLVKACAMSDLGIDADAGDCN